MIINQLSLTIIKDNFWGLEASAFNQDEVIGIEFTFLPETPPSSNKQTNKPKTDKNIWHWFIKHWTSGKKGVSVDRQEINEVRPNSVLRKCAGHPIVRGAQAESAKSLSWRRQSWGSRKNKANRGYKTVPEKRELHT